MFHLNLFAARNWIQIPNDYDQLAQDQRQRVQTWNIAPGYQHTFNPHSLLTVNPYIRKDDFNYYPSRDVLDDLPSTQSEHRKLMNYGLRGDISISEGRHNIKLGVDLKQTRLYEQFGFGVTDSTFNPPCLDTAGNAVTDSGITDPDLCNGLGYTANPGLQPGLIPFDLSRGGSLFRYQRDAQYQPVLHLYSGFDQPGESAAERRVARRYVLRLDGRQRGIAAGGSGVQHQKDKYGFANRLLAHL